MLTTRYAKNVRKPHEMILIIATRILNLPLIDGKYCELDDASILVIKNLCNPDFRKTYELLWRHANSKAYIAEQTAGVVEDIQEVAESQDLNGYSSHDVMLLINNKEFTNAQRVARAMRAAGYVNTVLYLGDFLKDEDGRRGKDRQGRRWFKDGVITEEGRERAKRIEKERREVSFL